MSNKTLIVGCSYVAMLSPFIKENYTRDNQLKPQLQDIDHKNICIIGSTGCGNSMIAYRVLYECSQTKYDSVIVLWSGVNRYDHPIGHELHECLTPKYEYVTKLDNTVWYHSGGWGASGMQDECPPDVRHIFKTTYLGATPLMLSEISAWHIASTQSLLTQLNIPYKMSFIYDINVDYDRSTSQIEPGCGKFNNNSQIANLINWDKIEKQSPYEWCKTRDLMYSPEDQFHWSVSGAKQWFREVLNFEITKQS